MIDQSKGYRTLIVGGDLNCSIGIDIRTGIERVVGPQARAQTNKSGKELVELCIELGLFVTSSLTTQNSVDKSTWWHDRFNTGHVLTLNTQHKHRRGCGKRTVTRN